MARRKEGDPAMLAPTSAAQPPATQPAATPVSGPQRSAARRNRAAFWFLAPACVMTLVYVLYPILYTIYLSFFSWDGMTDPKFVGLANYIELFHAPTFYTA
jgi:multiple sugar transport system permease protein